MLKPLVLADLSTLSYINLLCYLATIRVISSQIVANFFDKKASEFTDALNVYLSFLISRKFLSLSAAFLSARWKADK